MGRWGAGAVVGLLLIGLHTVGARADEPTLVNRHSAGITAWLYRNTSPLARQGTSLPTCGAECESLWGAEQRLEAASEASQEIWREMYRLAEDVGIFGGFGTLDKISDDPPITAPGTYYGMELGYPATWVGVERPYQTANSRRYEDPDEIIRMAWVDGENAYLYYDIKAPTYGWLAGVGPDVGADCPADDLGLDRPGPDFQRLEAPGPCARVVIGTDGHAHTYSYVGYTQWAWFAPLKFDGPPRETEPPAGHYAQKVGYSLPFNPGAETVRQSVISHLTNEPDKYSALLGWLSEHFGEPLDHPSERALYGGVNPAAPNLVHTCAGDPVDCATGNFSETFQDTSVHGLGPELSFTRTYNSQAAGDGEQGPFGPGWSAEFFERLDVDPDTGEVVLRQGNAAEARFRRDANGVLKPAPWVQATLQEFPGVFSILRQPDQTVMIFNPDGQLMGLGDRNGNFAVMAYKDGRLDSVTDQVNRKLTFAYNDDALITKITAPDGGHVDYSYTDGRLTAVKDLGGATTSFEYDQSSRIIKVTDARGVAVTTNTYDDVGRVVAQNDALGRTTSWAYQLGETTITHPNGSKTREEFDALLPVKIVRASGTTDPSSTTMAYDDNKNLVSVIDGEGAETKYEYDALGNRTAVIDPLGRATRYTYDGQRNITSVETPSGRQTTFTYDGHGNLLRTRRHWDEQNRDVDTTMTYTTRGQLASVTDALGRTTTYAYDSYGNPASTTSPAGRKTTTINNVLGLPLVETSARGWVAGATPLDFSTVFVRDAYGRPTAVRSPNLGTTTYEYDAVGDITNVTDANGHTTTTVFDDARQAVERHRADGTVWKMSYTSMGQVASQADGSGNVTTFGYDAKGHLVRVMYPDSSYTETYTYDKAGRKVSKRALDGTQTRYAYDAAGQLQHVDNPVTGASDVDLDYDVDGRRTSMTDPTGTSSFAYDSLDRMVSHTSGANQTTGYGFDAAGQLVSIDYPTAKTAVDVATGSGGADVGRGTVTRQYDQDGNLTAVSDWLGNTTSFVYDADAEVIEMHRPNGVTARYAYNRDGALSSLEDGGATTMLGRDPKNLLTSLSAGGPGVSFSYDAVDRLAGGDGWSFSYDNADNLIGLQPGAGPAVVQQVNAGGQVTSVTRDGVATALSYDRNGQRSVLSTPGAPSMSFSWDRLGRLTSYRGPDRSVASGGSVTQSYTYDGDGRRQSTTTAGQRTQLAYDLSGELALIIEDGATAYVTGPDGLPIEQITADDTVRYFHHDQLGSTTALTDASGATVQTYSYTPWGEPTGPAPTVTNPFGYAGQYTDWASGLQYLRARYYDPATGQFISRDPLTAQTRQPYAYADNDPVNATDPAGLSVLGFVRDHWRGAVGFASGAATITVCVVPAADLACGPAIAGNAVVQSALVVTDPDLSGGQKAAGVAVNVILAGGATLSTGTAGILAGSSSRTAAPPWIRGAWTAADTSLGYGLELAMLKDALCR